jgi:hypothetical protein
MSKKTMMAPLERQRLLASNYTIEVAGSQVGFSRSAAYRAADAGVIPTKWHGPLRLVPRRPWDRKVRELLK